MQSQTAIERIASPIKNTKTKIGSRVYDDGATDYISTKAFRLPASLAHTITSTEDGGKNTTVDTACIDQLNKARI